MEYINYIATGEHTMTPISTRKDDHGQSDRYHLTETDAIVLVKAQPAKTTFYVRAWADAPVSGEPGKVYANALCIGVQVTRKHAARMISGALGKALTEKGALFPVSIYTTPDGYRAVYLLG